VKLSATRLKTLLTCPRQFRYLYVDEIPAVFTGPLAFGQVIHEVIHRLQVHSVETGDVLDVEYAFQQFASLWQEVLQRDRPLFKNGATEVQQYRNLADVMLKGYVERHKDATPPLVVEYPFTLPWGEHVIEGIVDRLDEGESGLIIVDFKTGKRKPSPKDLQTDLQLTIYAYAVEQLFDQPVERIVYYHLRDQTPLVTTRSEGDFRWLLDEVVPYAVQRIEAGAFAPRFGYWCRFCHFKELCQAEGPEDAHGPRVDEALVLPGDVIA